MKKFTVIARNVKNGHCVVMTEIEANSRREAQAVAMKGYYKYLNSNEQMVVANDRQWKEIWQEAVERTDAIAQ